jgi:hypothetical protein
LHFGFAHLAAAHLVASNGWNWPGTDAPNIEIDATLLTVKLLTSMSGMERAFRIELCQQPV